MFLLSEEDSERVNDTDKAGRGQGGQGGGGGAKGER